MKKKYTFIELFSLLYSLGKKAKKRGFSEIFRKYLGSTKIMKSCQLFFAFLGFSECQKIAQKNALFQNYFLCYIV